MPELARATAREARLTGAGVLLGPLEELPDKPDERARVLRTLCTALRGIPLFTYGTSGWEPAWAADTPVTLTVAAPTPDRHVARWRHALEGAAGEHGAGGDAHALARSVSAHRLDAGQLRRAADTAVRTAALDGRPLSPTACAPPYGPRTARARPSRPSGGARGGLGRPGAARPHPPPAA